MTRLEPLLEGARPRHLVWVTTAALVALVACSGAESRTTAEATPSAAPSEGPAERSSPSSPKPSAGTDAGSLAKTFVDAHNRYRSAHCAPPLEWSPDVAKTAQAWANELARSGCTLRHSKTDLGENLAAGTAGTIGPERAVDIWYAENKSYDFAHGTFSMAAGHFTQLVWKGSRHLGCGAATCADKQIWVCNYDPPGNIQGEFAPNVDRPTCKK